MTLINLAKGCHPYLSVLGDVLLVPVILSLASSSRFPREWPFFPALGIHRYHCDTLAVLPAGTWPRSLWVGPFREECYKREVAVWDYKIR